jgi:hypothetical protein
MTRQIEPIRNDGDSSSTYLTQTTDGDTMRSVAEEVANDRVGGIGFEGDAIIVVVDGGIFDGDIRGTVNIPAI